MKPKDNLEVYPNPATDIITLKIPERLKGERLQLHVYDLGGKKIYTTTIISFSGFENLDVTKFSKGNYILQVRNDVLSYQAKFVVN